MESKEVVDMIWEALRTMAIGIPGVFSVLAVFYGAVKLLMLKTDRENK
jgi:ABC-type arginine transport system permease subunit